VEQFSLKGSALKMSTIKMPSQGRAAINSRLLSFQSERPQYQRFVRLSNS
jgi:hypothetical protein